MSTTRYVADGPLIGNLGRWDGGRFRLHPTDTYPTGTPLTLTGNVTHPGKCCRQITPRTWLGLRTPRGCTQPLQYDKANAIDINLKKHEGKRLKKSKCTYFSPLGAINHLWSGVAGVGGSFV